MYDTFECTGCDLDVSYASSVGHREEARETFYSASILAENGKGKLED